MKRSKQYDVGRSPLFGVQSIHVLARSLRVSPGDLREASNFHDDYYEGTVERKGKIRQTQTPVRRTRRIHERILALLARIKVPSYLHSGTKGRSYVTNAFQHLGSQQAFCVDITDFFNSTTWYHVYKCFRLDFRCAEDIAGIIATICTYKDHLPTGSPVSTLLSFFTHRRMFDALFDMSRENGIKMTVLLDDITFSGKRISAEFKSKVRRTVSKSSLRIKRRKEKFYHLGATPEITGIILKDGRLIAPWRRHKASHEAIGAVKSAQTVFEFDKAYNGAMSRMTEIATVEDRKPHLKSKLRAFRSKRRPELPR